MRFVLAKLREMLEWVKAHTDETAQIVQGRYIQQDLELIRTNLRKFVWQGLKDQPRVMSDEGLFAQVDFVIDILYKDMKAIPVKPDFRHWVNLNALPVEESAGD